MVVGEDDHVFSGVSEALAQVPRDISDIVDATSKFAALAKIVDADQECLSTTSTVGVLEGVCIWSSMSKADHSLWWWGSCWLAGYLARGDSAYHVRRIAALDRIGARFVRNYQILGY